MARLGIANTFLYFKLLQVQYVRLLVQNIKK